MNAHRRLLAVALPLALLLAAAGPAGAAAGEMKLYDRLYLLASGEGFLHFGVDPNDPELSVAKVVANCPGSVPLQGNGATCFTSNGTGTPPPSNLDLRFMPGSLLGEDITWDAANPLRYHFEMKVTSTMAPTLVALVTERGGFPTEAQPATQVAPNIWEGKTGGSGTLSQGDRIRVRVRVPNNYQANRTTFEIATGGASWIQLPKPIRAVGVPELIRQSPDAATPPRFDTPSRHFTFNDANYTIGGPYTGDLSQLKTFDLPIPRDASIVYAWVELWDTPFAYDVLGGGSADARKVNDAAMLRLFHDDDLVGSSSPEGNQQRGRGTNALAVNSLPSGELSLEVKARPRFTGDLAPAEAVMPPNHPYKAYILAVHGDRTLQSMRWRFETAITEPFVPASVPGTNTCVNSSEPVPTTKEATSFSVDLEWNSPSIATARYTLGWNAGGQEFSFCGQSGSGDRVRLVNPAEKVWQIGPTPAKDTVMAAWRDTVFEMAVRYTYTRPPCTEPDCEEGSGA